MSKYTYVYVTVTVGEEPYTHIHGVSNKRENKLEDFPPYVECLEPQIDDVEERTGERVLSVNYL